MKPIYIVLLIILFPVFVYSQSVGIGIDNPNDNVVLQVQDPNFQKGILIPSTYDLSIVSCIEGALIYYNKEFYYCTSAEWKRVGEDTHFDIFYNTFVGDSVLADLPIGLKPTHNTAIGRRALKELKDPVGERNTAIGSGSQEKNLQGFNNTSLGYLSLHNNSQSNMNVAIGNFSMYDLNPTSPAPLWTLNTSVGTNSLRGIADGKYNTVLGGQAMYLFTTRNHEILGNTAVGYNALHENPGSYNVAIGHEAGANDSTSMSLFIDIADIGTNSLIYGRFNDNFLAFNGNVQIKDTLNVSADGIKFANQQEVNKAVPVQYGIVAQNTAIFGSNIGEIKMYGLNTGTPGNAPIPSGVLPCDGSAVSRTTYVDLFNYIGTTYGEGDGSTTFNVPDMRKGFGTGQ